MEQTKLKLSELGDLNWTKVQFKEGCTPFYRWNDGFDPWCSSGQCEDLQEICDFINADIDEEEYKISVDDIEDDLPLYKEWENIEV